MPSTIPVWLALAVALLTGTFTLAGQIVSGILNRKSQSQLFFDQQKALRRARLVEKLEFIYSGFFNHFDTFHTSVVMFQHHKRGMRTAKSVITSIEAPADNENYKNLMMAVNLYAPELVNELQQSNRYLGECQTLLTSWSKDNSIDIEDDLKNKFKQALDAFEELRKRICQKINE